MLPPKAEKLSGGVADEDDDFAPNVNGDVELVALADSENLSGVGFLSSPNLNAATGVSLAIFNSINYINQFL